MKKTIKKKIRKILGPGVVRGIVQVRNNIFGARDSFLRKFYASNNFKLALMNLMEDSGSSPQVFKYGNENIYFKSWKSSYVGAILKETYIDSIYDWFFKKNQRNDLVVVDLGANVGFFTQYARKFAKRVIAVEPSAEICGYLKRAKEENNWTNVEIVQVAISDYTAQGVRLFTNELNSTASSLSSKMHEGAPSELVDTLSLVDLFKRYNLMHVDFLKMDVEGAELDIIKTQGFKDVLPKIDVIEIEIHFDRAYQEQVVDLLRSYGLKVSKVVGRVYIVTK